MAGGFSSDPNLAIRRQFSNLSSVKTQKPAGIHAGRLLFKSVTYQFP